MYPTWEEPDAPEYERQPIYFEGTADAMFNTHAIQFPEAECEWGRIAGICLFATPDGPEIDELAGGSVSYGALVDKGARVNIAALDVCIGASRSQDSRDHESQ